MRIHIRYCKSHENLYQVLQVTCAASERAMKSKVCMIKSLSPQQLMSTQHAQYVLLFIVLAVNFNRFQFYGVTHSYTSCPFLCGHALYYGDTYTVYQVHMLLQCVFTLVWTLVLGREDLNGLGIPPPDHASATCRPLTHIKASLPLMDVGTLRTGSLQSVAV